MSSQLNVRIDPDVRAAGDATLAEIGYTAGEFVRTIWSKLAQRGRVAEEIRALLRGADEPLVNSVNEDIPLSHMSELAASVAQMCHTATYDASITPYDVVDLDRKLLWGELDDRMHEVVV